MPSFFPARFVFQASQTSTLLFALLLGASGTSWGQSAGAAMSNGTGQGRGSQNLVMQLSALQRELNRTNAPTSAGLENLRIPPQLLYFTGGWETGSILPSGTAGTAAPASQRLRYNVVLQRLEVEDAAQKAGFSILKPDATAGFVLRSVQPNYHFVARPYYTENHARQYAFFEALAQGPVQLLILHEFSIKPAEVNELFNVEGRPEQYQRTTRLFASEPGKPEVAELDLAKQPVLKLFDKAARPDLIAYVAANNLSYSDINHVLKLVNYYNSRHSK